MDLSPKELAKMIASLGYDAAWKLLSKDWLSPSLVTCKCRRHYLFECGKTLEQKDPAFPICYNCFTSCNGGT